MTALACALTIFTAGCVAPRAGSGAAASSTPSAAPASEAARFVYSPYKYVPVGWDADAAAIATTAGGRVVPLAADARSTLPAGVVAVTLAFATGECGAETWDGVDPDVLARVNVRRFERAGIDYIVSTGGEAGTFSCATDAGMERFIARYASSRLIGLDFDIERGQSAELLASLVRRIKAAKDRHAGLRISFTLATWASSDGSGASLNADGERVMAAIRGAGLDDFYVNLMAMDYGTASARNCVVVDGVCDMGRSAMQAARNVAARFAVPLARIELTPMIGVNDVMTNVFTLDDAAALGGFVREAGLGGLHFWALDRDTPCPHGAAIVLSACSGLDAAPYAFTRAFARALQAH
ncbi:MAG TPA: glycosyl hydrolase [Casimicrobiaceae bacterium]|nr:glycosyl hydrolase [Casimicrobiaceae bacterium]